MTVTALNPGGVRNLLTRRENVKAAYERHLEAFRRCEFNINHGGENRADWEAEERTLNDLRLVCETAGMPTSEPHVSAWVEDYLSEGEGA